MQVWPSTIRVVLVLLGVLVYGNSLAGQFIFDDLVSIVWNPHLRQLWPPTAPPQSPLAAAPALPFSMMATDLPRWRRK